MIQFSYRAVTYQNLALLLGVFLVVMAIRSSGLTSILGHRFISIVAICCLLLAAYGVVVKWPRIRSARRNRGSDKIVILHKKAQPQALIQLPDYYYFIADYTTSDRFVALSAETTKAALPALFPVDSRTEFGIPQQLEVSYDEEMWARTNIQAFPWNRLEIDGKEVAESDVREYDNLGLALRVPAGPHRLQARFAPDLGWRVLRIISLVTLFGWLIGEFVVRPSGLSLQGLGFKLH